MWLLYNVAFLQQHGFHFNDVALLDEQHVLTSGEVTGLS